MALVVFLRGVNVGGQRRFRPSALARQLKHLDVLSVGAAGTFVVRKHVSQSKVRLELARRLPFDTEIAICRGHEIVRLMTHNPFSENSPPPGVVRCVSILSKRARFTPPTPMEFPQGKWLLKVLGRDGRFVFGQYRRHMKVIGYLSRLDRMFGVRATTRNWNTISAIAKILERTS